MRAYQYFSMLFSPKQPTVVVQPILTVPRSLRDGAPPRRQQQHNLFLFVSIVCFSGFVNNICFNIGADRQVFAFRQSYLHNVLFLDMRHYDVLDIHGVQGFNWTTHERVERCKRPTAWHFRCLSMPVFAGLVIALLTAWKIALVLLAVMPILVCAIGGFLL